MNFNFGNAGGGPGNMANAMFGNMFGANNHAGGGGAAGAVDNDGWQVPPAGWGGGGGVGGNGGAPAAYPQVPDDGVGPSTGPPPASAQILARLPIVKVTPDDMERDGNDVCCICMEDHVVGARATKLPCGHIYHGACVEAWLAKHCTCPVCRFELDTEDRAYEEGRKRRMSSRRIRYRRSELEGMSVRTLKQLCSSTLGIDVSQCVEKSEIVAAIACNSSVEIVAESAQPRFAKAHLVAMSVGELRRYTHALGVDCVGCLTKEDMVDRMVEVGAITLEAKEDETGTKTGYGAEIELNF